MDRFWQQIALLLVLVLVLVLETNLVTATGSTVPISVPSPMIARSFDYEHRFTEHEHRCAEHEQERYSACGPRCLDIWKGYRITTLDGGSIVDAAHIHQFADSGNNDPRNGLALSKNAHWLFDRGLWSIDDDFRVLVATEEFAESCPDQESLTNYRGRKLRLPINKQLWPDRRHCRWHRKHRFRGSA